MKATELGSNKKGGDKLEPIVKSSKSISHVTSTGVLARAIRAVLTGDRQAITIMPMRKDIEAAQTLQQLAMTKSALCTNSQIKVAGSRRSQGSSYNVGITPRHKNKVTTNSKQDASNYARDRGCYKFGTSKKDGMVTTIKDIASHVAQFYHQGGHNLERMVISSLLTISHKISAGTLAWIMRALLTEDRQAILVAPAREDIKAAQGLQ